MFRLLPAAVKPQLLVPQAKPAENQLLFNMAISNSAMTRKSKLFRGQSTIEYTLLIVGVIGALLAMQAYFKRGVQGRLRENVENIGKQYDPDTADSNYQMSASSNSTTEITSAEEDGKIKATTNTDSTTNSTMSGNENIGAF